MTAIQFPDLGDVVRQCLAQHVVLCRSSVKANGLQLLIQKKKKEKKNSPPKRQLKNLFGQGKKGHLEDKNPEWMTRTHTPCRGQ